VLLRASSYFNQDRVAVFWRGLVGSLLGNAVSTRLAKSRKPGETDLTIGERATFLKLLRASERSCRGALTPGIFADVFIPNEFKWMCFHTV